LTTYIYNYIMPIMDCQEHNINADFVLHHPERCSIIACETVIEEMLPLIPPIMKYQVLDFGLHVKPDSLKIKLQETIDNSSKDIEVIILGYGLCSQAVVGLKSDRFTLVIPKVDDCIAIFLGSVESYDEQHKNVPGTYYLTKGWIEVGDTPFEEYESVVKQYGKERADKIYLQLLKNYTRLAFINTGNYNLAQYQTYAKNTALKFNLRYEEIAGSDSLAKKLIQGPWDKNILVIPPGKIISFLDFR
jgi:hypothetical protein